MSTHDKWIPLCKGCIHDKVCPIWDGYNDCPAERNPDTCENYLPAPTVEMLEIIQDAVEKRIPSKPENKSNNPDNWEVMCCPSCGKVFWNTGNSLRYVPKYCDICGQAIDWSDY